MTAEPTTTTLLQKKFDAWGYTWADFWKDFETKMTETITTTEQAKPKKQTDWEGKLAEQIEAALLPLPLRQHKGIPGRQYKFDFCWGAPFMIVAEVEGGVYGKFSRHTSMSGFTADCAKYNLATLQGWQVFRFTSTMVRDGIAIDTLKKVFKQEATKILQTTTTTENKTEEKNNNN